MPVTKGYTSTGGGLLRAVIAAPDDDLPRLVFADWLRENGEPERADLIEVQCSPAARPSDLARVLGGTGTGWVTAGVGDPEDWAWSGGLMSCYDDPVEVVTSVGAVLSYRRGFIESVRCRLAGWCGSQCERCHVPPDASGRCPQCWQDGFVLGIGPRLVREHPVERVVTDREPEQWEGENWRWTNVAQWEYDGQTLDSSDAHLPEDVFLLLPEVYTPGSCNCPATHWFSTRETADAALSDALIAWAKSQEVGDE